MRCPRCVQDLVSAAPQCQHCGFSLAELDDVYGAESVFLDRLTDAAHCFRPADIERVDRELDRFERAFPQLFVAVYLGFLPERAGVRQFGFWLLNHASMTSIDLGKTNRSGALLVIDLTSQSAGLTLGYDFEPFLTDRDLTTVIQSARPMLVAGDHGRAVERIVRRMAVRLRRRVSEFRARPMRFLQSGGWEGAAEGDTIEEGDDAKV